jgi:hypothetical protein
MTIGTDFVGTRIPLRPLIASPKKFRVECRPGDADRLGAHQSIFKIVPWITSLNQQSAHVYPIIFGSMDVDTPSVSEETAPASIPVSYAPTYSTSDDTSQYSTNGNEEPNSMDVTVEATHDDSQQPGEMTAHEEGLQPAEEQAQQEEIKRQRLVSARAALQTPDAILEDDVFANIKAIFESGGSPQEIIKSLSGSYRGFPQMVNLVSHWLRRAGAPDSEIISLVESHIRYKIREKFDPQKADKIFGMGSVCQAFFMLNTSYSTELL